MPREGTQLLSSRRLLLALDEAVAKLEAVERARIEPIAITGMACRLPGADDLESFWLLLRDGVDAVGEVPADRWDVEALFDPDPDAPGKTYSRHGAFLDEVDQFDPNFFGIAPREARSMDPQQRLILEVAWQALENGGQPPGLLSGSRTGVYVGITLNDYASLLTSPGAVAALDAYAGSGNALNAAAGRLSYVLGLQGPSMAVDTACSSSLVCVHLACQSLRAWRVRPSPGRRRQSRPVPRSDRRLFQGAHAGPGRPLQDVRCGGGRLRPRRRLRVVVLKRLSDAVADGDRILARNPGIGGQPGWPSSGLTAPNGPAQQELIRAGAGRRRRSGRPRSATWRRMVPARALGDPIEVRALAAVYGRGRRPDQPLLIGSVKTNIGHLESAAAGIAGLIKAVLALEHGRSPRTCTSSSPIPTSSGTSCPWR